MHLNFMDPLLGVRCLLECARRSPGHSFTVYLFSLKGSLG